jgi:4-methyl-5(b-hydroxyethyl)-thiazole monophosphate biosynthesis
MSKKVLVPLAPGFEEIEAITIIDVLRRAGIEVVTVSLNSIDVKGAHNIPVIADKRIVQIKIDEYDGIVLPGGMPGAKNLKENSQILNFVRKINEKKGLVAAICAAPMVLETAGILENVNATSYPSFKKEVPSCNYKEERVVKDGNIITSRGAGVALEFALEVVEYLEGRDVKEDLIDSMLVNT